MNYTPKQYRAIADQIGGDMARLMRAHADALERIAMLEDAERVILASIPEEHRASTAAGSAQNYIAHLEGRIAKLEEVVRGLIGSGECAIDNKYDYANLFRQWANKARELVK